MDKLKRLGIDVGGVITDKARNDGTDTSFKSGNYLATTAIPEAFETIACIAREIFSSKNIFIVSMCGPETERKTREWLDHHCFSEITGVGAEQFNFCRSRKAKGPICQDLQITHFIDDNMGVLIHLPPVTQNRFLFQPRPDDMARYRGSLSAVTQVNSWREVLEKLQQER